AVIGRRSEGAIGGGYLANAFAAIEVEAQVRIGMMFLNMRLFEGIESARAFRGGYTYEVECFRKY
ncbi:MAG: hypothetical protein LBS84_05925, partial [Clostridiales bacterium]|nr:hypothetical protein [Clostridiales bacterium]